MAIDDVIIIENSSHMHDEILAHRLGLIPLKTDLDTYVLPEKCTCKSELGCIKCRVTLTLDAEAVDAPRIVFSGELVSDNPDVVPLNSEIPIVTLTSGQKVRLEAYARLGRGMEHAKWQPVTACSYKYMPQVIVGGECNGCGECVNICPKRVLMVEGGKLIVTDNLKCTLCRECEKVCPQKPPAVNVNWDKDSFIFYVESSGALPPERIVEEAAKILKEKAEEFVGLLNKIEEG